jgi:hypothetical protein
MRGARKYCQPLLAMSRGFFVFEIAPVDVLVIDKETPGTKAEKNKNL